MFSLSFRSIGTRLSHLALARQREQCREMASSCLERAKKKRARRERREREEDDGRRWGDGFSFVLMLLSSVRPFPSQRPLPLLRPWLLGLTTTREEAKQEKEKRKESEEKERELVSSSSLFFSTVVECLHFFRQNVERRRSMLLYVCSLDKLDSCA